MLVPPTPLDPSSAAWASEVAAQTVNLTALDGSAVTLSLYDIDDFYVGTEQGLIVTSFGMGMCAVLFIAMLVLSKPEKRRTIIFGLNLGGLFIQFMRCLMNSIISTNMGFSLAQQFLDLTPLFTMRDYVPQFMFISFTILWYMVILSSLVLQVRVVFAAEPKYKKFFTFG